MTPAIPGKNTPVKTLPGTGGTTVSVVWIIVIVLAVIGLLALLGRGRFWGT
jgi:hypothetical protein